MSSPVYIWNDERLEGDAALDERIDAALAQLQAMPVHSVCWDECHKIYVCLDNAQTDEMRDLGYLVVEGIPKSEMLDVLGQWYSRSCGLRFINLLPSLEPVVPQIFVDDSGQES